MRRVFFAALMALFAVAASQVQAQNLQAHSLQAKANEIRAAMDARDFDRAERLVRDLQSADPAGFTRNNYDYLLGRLAERRGARAEAGSLYNAVINRSSVLAPYALWHLSIIARSSGDLALERQHITRLVAVYSATAPARTARDRMVESLRESKDYRATIALLRPVASTSGVRGRSALARLGEAFARTGDQASARASFNRLISGSRDDYALAASEGLDALDRADGSRPDEFEALRRARIYLFNRHWSDARAHLVDIVERFPASPNRAEALYQTGFTYYREDNYTEAVKWFDRAHREFPDKKDGEQGFYYVGTALQKAQKYEEAARRYMAFIDQYPASDLIEGAYRNVVDSLRYAGKDAEAIEWSRRIMERYAGKPLAAVGLFNEARIELTRGNFDAALRLLTRLEAYPANPKLVSSAGRGEAAFLKIYAMEKTGRVSEAVRLYLAIPDERDNYYGYRATERLRALAATEAGRRVIAPLARGYREQARAALASGRYGEAKDAATQALRLASDQATENDLLSVLRSSYSQLPAYNLGARFQLVPAARSARLDGQAAVTDSAPAPLAAELIFLGLYDEGSPLLRVGGFGGARASVEDDGEIDENSVGSVQVSTAQSGGNTAYSLAVYSNRGDHAHYAIAFAEPVFRSIPRDYRLELMPRDLAELMYPAPYRDALTRFAAAHGIDPRIVLALARQESRFNPSVKSGAAARGLLQFISETAIKMAEAEGLQGFELDDVYDPQVAVRLAVRYVAELLKMFPDNPYAVAASYNTGEANVERWIFRARSNDIERLVAEIAIPETKDYVGKVMSNYKAYRHLYTQELRPKR